MTAIYTIRTNCSATVDLEIIMEIEADSEDEARKIFAERVPKDVNDMAGIDNVGGYGSEITIDQASVEEVQEDLVEIDSVEPIEEEEDEEEEDEDDE
jgi:hypothetical protein